MHSTADLRKKVAVITGAGKGIGLEIARELVQAGAKVILNDVEEQLAQQAAKVVDPSGLSCLPVAGDCSDPTLIRQLVDQAVKSFGQVDIAVANAGITLFGDFFDYSPQDFYRVCQVNLGGSFFLAQAAAKQMKSQTRGGAILLMSSVTGHQAHRHLAAYGMTKAAIEMLAKNLVLDLSPYGITINAIAPGATLTERTVEDKAYEKTWCALTPMGRPARVEDIAQAALFLVSDAARHITGQTLIIDGGWTSISPNP